jgi:hypothetical protein
MMKSNVFNVTTSTIATACILLLTACGGGAGSSAIPETTLSPQTSNPTPATSAYGPVKASLTLSPLSQDIATNANLTPFYGSPSMCSTKVAGANMCLGGLAGMTGTAVAATAGKCIYLNLGINQLPRGFDIIFHAADGRVLQLTSTTNFQPLEVGQNISASFGDIALYQPDTKQWLSNGNSSSPTITVAAVSHNQIILNFDHFVMPASTGFGAVGSIAMTGAATIDCDPRLDSVR